MPQVLYICETILGMRFFIIFLSFSILGVSCNDTNSKEEQKVPVTVVKDTTLYGKNSFRFPKVSANTQAILEDWPIYNDFQNEVLALQTLSLERVKLVSEKLLTKRPAVGIKPKYFERVVGKTANKKIKKDTAIQWEDIS